jgi:hypothetical protein
MKNELENIKNEDVVAYFKALCRYLPRGIEVIYENPQSVGILVKIRTGHILNTSQKY